MGYNSILPIIEHPTFAILCFVILLSITYHKDRIFNFIAIYAAPLMVIFHIWRQNTNSNVSNLNNISINIFDTALSYEYSAHNSLIYSILIVVLAIANAYSTLQSKKLEIIFGNLCAAFAFLALFASDFVSLICGVELMSIASACIILIGGHKDSMSCAGKYFFTHLLSGNMMVMGIVFIITLQGSIELCHFTDLPNLSQNANIALHVMLLGMLINIAAFPFSGWMAEYYSKASSSGFIYLILIPSKISIILLMKIFAGYKILIWVGILMMITSLFYASNENNIKKILCYLSITSMGFMLLGIANNAPDIKRAIYLYLLVHISYKIILAINCAIMSDFYHTDKCSDLQKIPSRSVRTSIICGILMMINIPIFNQIGLESKAIFLKDINISYELFFTFLPYIITTITLFALPFKQYYFSLKSYNITLPKILDRVVAPFTLWLLFPAIIISLLLFVQTLISASHTIPYMILEHIITQPNNMTDGAILLETLGYNILAFALVLIVGISLSIRAGRTRIDQKRIILLEELGRGALYVCHYLIKMQERLEAGFNVANDIITAQYTRSTKYISCMTRSLYNQESAIFIVFVFLIISFLSMLIL